MSIYSTSVKRPVTTILIFVALMVIGLYSLTQLPVDLYPEVELPFIGVVTTYPGASASDIETNITRPVEDMLNAVSNLKEITSTSSDGMSVIFMNGRVRMFWLKLRVFCRKTPMFILSVARLRT